MWPPEEYRSCASTRRSNAPQSLLELRRARRATRGLFEIGDSFCASVAASAPAVAERTRLSELAPEGDVLPSPSEVRMTTSSVAACRSEQLGALFCGDEERDTPDEAESLPLLSSRVPSDDASDEEVVCRPTPEAFDEPPEPPVNGEPRREVEFCAVVCCGAVH